MATIEFTDKAKENIRNMNYKCASIRNAFGPKSDEYLKARESLANVLARMIELGGKISAEDEFSLYGITDYGMHYGVIFFPRREKSEDDSYLKEYYAMCGEWSIHS